MVWPIIEKCSGASVDITMRSGGCQRGVARFPDELNSASRAAQNRNGVRAGPFQSVFQNVNVLHHWALSVKPPCRVKPQLVTILNHAETCHMELCDGAPQEARKASVAGRRHFGDSGMFQGIYQANWPHQWLVIGLVRQQ